MRVLFYHGLPLEFASVKAMKHTLSEAACRAYCSTANLGAGFDVFGLALDKYSDLVQVRLTQGRRIRIDRTGPYRRSIPADARTNSAGPPARALLKRARNRGGLVIRITKNVPPGLGLGSSGATAAASAKALDHLLRLNLSNDELVRAASLGERAVSGAAHADNVAASMVGGFVAVYDRPARTLSMKPPGSLRSVVVTPWIPAHANKTRRARSMVPPRVETGKAVLNIGRAAAIVAGFAYGNIELIGAGMQDEIAEPYRRGGIPGYDEARRLALSAGAAGVSVSGAGPSLIALLDGARSDPSRIGRAMAAGFALNKVQSKWFVARPAPGAKIVSEG